MAGFVPGFALDPALWKCQVLPGAAAGAVAGAGQCCFFPLTLLLGLILLVNDHGNNQVQVGWRWSAGGSLPSPSPGRIAAQGTVGVSSGKWQKSPSQMTSVEFCDFDSTNFLFFSLALLRSLPLLH